jgi:hypothetical protein
VRLYRRDFGSILPLPGVHIEVESYSWAAIGGPEAARLAVPGPLPTLRQTLGWLRCPVEIADAAGRLVWWGYVAEVEGVAGQVGPVSGISLDGMANRCAARFRNAGAGVYAPEGIPAGSGPYVHTAWAEDAESTAEYGCKEARLLLKTPTGLAAAEQARDNYLAQARYPVPQIAEHAASLAEGVGGLEREPLAGLGPSGQQEGGQSRAAAARAPGCSVLCRGWWSTLGWQYYSQPKGLEAWTDPAVPTAPDTVTAQAIAEIRICAAGTAQVAQSIRLAAGVPSWDCTSVALRAARAGQPADALRLALCADSGGLPGAELASATLDASQLGLGLRWVSLSLDWAVALDPDTARWLVIGRTGGPGTEDYFRVAVDEAVPYGRGELLAGNPLQPRIPAATLVFQALGSEETTAQVSAGLRAAPFITGVDLALASGLTSCPYRSGERRLDAEIEELLRLGAAGTPARGLLATAGPDRRVAIQAEPPAPLPGLAGTGDTYRLGPGGELRGPYGEAIAAHVPMVGVWVATDEWPAGANADVGWIGAPSPAFIVRCEVDARRGYRRLYSRQPAPGAG